MKKFVIVGAAAALLISSPVLIRAAEAFGSDHYGHGMAHIAQRLGLSPEQQREIQPILMQSFADMRQLRAQAQTQAYNALAPTHRAQVQQIVAQVRQQILALRASFAPGAPPNTHPFERMHEQIRPIVEQAARNIDALLSPQEAQAVLSVRNATLQQASALASSTATQMNRYLTPQQQQQVAAFMQKMATHRAGLAQNADPGRFLIHISALGMHQRADRGPF